MVCTQRTSVSEENAVEAVLTQDEQRRTWRNPNPRALGDHKVGEAVIGVLRVARGKEEAQTTPFLAKVLDGSRR